LGTARRFNIIRLQEPIALGQRVAAYRVEAWNDGAWSTISTGTTIGYKKLDQLNASVTARRVRIVIEDGRAHPLIAEVGLHLDPRAERR
jgi:alpha-L-fucosidase